MGPLEEGPVFLVAMFSGPCGVRWTSLAGECDGAESAGGKTSFLDVGQGVC